LATKGEKGRSPSRGVGSAPKNNSPTRHPPWKKSGPKPRGTPDVKSRSLGEHRSPRPPGKKNPGKTCRPPEKKENPQDPVLITPEWEHKREKSGKGKNRPTKKDSKKAFTPQNNVRKKKKKSKKKGNPLLRKLLEEVRDLTIPSGKRPHNRPAAKDSAGERRPTFSLVTL